MPGSSPLVSASGPRACSTTCLCSVTNNATAPTPAPRTSVSSSAGPGAAPRFPYAPAPESRAVLSLRPSYGLFIDGDFVEPLDGGHFKTESPSSQEVRAEAGSAAPADVDRAVRAARRAQEEVWG